MNKKIPYADMLPYCKSVQQRDLIKHLMNGHTIPEAAKFFGRKKNNMYRSLKSIRIEMTMNGYGEHFVSEEIMPEGMMVKSTSTMYDKYGKIKLQWVKSDKEAEDKLQAISNAIMSITEGVKSVKPVKMYEMPRQEDLLNVYISNDLHFGAYMWGAETLDRDYDLDIAEEQLDAAMEYLVETSPRAKIAIVADLGDTTEGDNFKNATPGHGHTLDVDGRYSKVIRVAMQSMVSLVSKALLHHELVYFINIGGNHDPVTSHAIRAFVEAWFRNEPRVIVDTSPAPQKYFLHGTTLLGFAHGDGLRMTDAGETMTMHNGYRWSETRNRYYHFGHNHKDKIIDGRLCKAESHRNMAPLNAWAGHAGFGRGVGTMKSITYCTRSGEKSRNLFNVEMMDEEK